MTIKQEFLKFKEILNIMLKSGFLFTRHSGSIDNTQIHDIYYILLGIKEFIRNLEQVYLSKFGKVYIYVENRYARTIANLALKELPYATKYLSFIRLSRNIKKPKRGLSLLIIIGSPKRRVFLESLRVKVNFIHVINDNQQQKITGLYHMNNKISTLNKIVFLFVLIDQIFSNIVKEVNSNNA